MKLNYPDSLTIQQYLEGKLDPETSHQLEKQALDDPFLWDALEGYSAYKDPAEDLSILQRQLHQRIVHLQENKKVFDLTWQRLSVAAAAAVMFVSAGILFWMNSQHAPEQLASQSQKPVEVSVIDRDSVQVVISSKNNPEASTLETKTSDNGGKTAVPTTGWASYREYVKLQAGKFQAEPRRSGSVLLAFLVDPNGKVISVKVKRGLNDAYNKEAVRIIQQGPAWKPSVNREISEMTFEVKF